MTSIILVRHAECEGNIINALTGRTEFKLTKNGQEMAQDLVNELKKYKINIIYSSPSIRCIETIKPTAEYFKLDIITNKDLLEKYFGIYDGMTWEEVNKQNPEIIENKKKFNEIRGIPEQETTKQVELRMKCCIQKIARENKGNTVLICSHGCAIYNFLKSIDKSNLDKANGYSQSNAAINMIKYESEKFDIISINQVNHLRIRPGKEEI